VLLKTKPKVENLAEGIKEVPGNATLVCLINAVSRESQMPTKGKRQGKEKPAITSQVLCAPIVILQGEGILLKEKGIV